MLRIGLTGGSGSGKGFVSAIFAKEGIPSLDTDRLSREVTAKGSACLKELVSALGEEILTEDGSLDRRKTAAITFADSEKYKVLNRITHHYILAECRRWLDEREQAGCLAAIVDAPLLIESGLHTEMDEVGAVQAPLDVRIERLKQRDGLDEKAIALRLSRQKDDSFYAANADFVIVNDGDSDAVIRQVKETVNRWKSGERKGKLSE